MTAPTTRPTTSEAVGEDAPEWFRQSVHRDFRVGDRVRVRLSAECQKVPLKRSAQAEWGVTKGHCDWEDGLIGVVRHIRNVDHPATREGHPFSVVWDIRRDGYSGAHYAAIELESIAAAPDADSGSR